MKYNEIYTFEDLKKYCKINQEITTYFGNTQPPLKDLHTSPTRALGYRLFESMIMYDNVLSIKGIIYSYNTPIGLITSSALITLISKQAPFKSATTKKLLTILNRNTYKLPLMNLLKVLKDLNIKLGWLE